MGEIVHCCQRRDLHRIVTQRHTYYSVNVKVTQSCPTLCDSMDYTVQGILQARIPGYWNSPVAVTFSRGSSQPKDQTQVSRIAGGFFTS